MLKIKNIIGFLFICLGFLANRPILEKIVSPYAIVSLNYRIPIIFIDFVLIIVGLLVIFLKKEYFTRTKISSCYKFIALNFFTVFLLFVSFNVFIYVFLVIRDISFYKDQIFFSYSKPLSEIYPNYIGRQLNLLLYETWGRPYVYEPYTQFKERPFKGKYVNVHKEGFRFTKEQGPWPLDPKNLNIFLFGGSTAFGYGVSDNETIASYLQDLFLNKTNVKVYNFGRGNYFSSQERILFEELLTKGYKPDVAIFLDGLNDFYYSNNEPLLTERFRKFIESKGTSLFDLPLVNIVKDIKKIGDIEHENRSHSEEETYNDQELIKTAVNRYTNNKKLIESISNSFNVKTVFVWQPVPTYKYDLNYHIFSGRGFGRFLYSKYGYAYMEEFVKKNNLGSNFLWLADIQENLKKSLYVDIDHYSSEMSKILAKEIYSFLIKKDIVTYTRSNYT